MKSRDVLTFLIGVEIAGFIYWITTNTPPIFSLACMPLLMMVWLALKLKEQKQKKRRKKNMNNEISKKLKYSRHPYNVEVSTLDTMDDKRNDQIDVTIQNFQSFSTSRDKHGVKTVSFIFKGGIVRVHFHDPLNVIQRTILKIAKNISERRKT